MSEMVQITNLTDVKASGHTPQGFDLFNTSLAPGESIKVPARLVTSKLTKVAETKKISVGDLPDWYVAAKNRLREKLHPTFTKAQAAEVVTTHPVPAAASVEGEASTIPAHKAKKK